MKKKLLFVIDSLSLGGAEKSLVNLLYSMDYTKFNVDLFLFHKKGLFLELLPREVRVLNHSKEWTCFQQPLMKSIIGLSKASRLDLIYHRLALSCKSNLLKLTQPLQQKLWQHFSPAIPNIKGEYDVAIGYLEKYPNYFIVEKVKAKKKIGWIHIDYNMYGLDAKFDAPYLKRLDYIVGVSKSCIHTLSNSFPEVKDKLVVIENISSPKLINEMAGQEIPFKKNGITIVTAARLVEQKGLNMSIEAASILHKNGYKFNWIIVGEGPLRGELQRIIDKNGLSRYVTLIGAVANPYPYIKTADIYVQTSLFEGKSISIDEAKILNKPIVATRFSTVYDQIYDGRTGILADMDAYSVYEKIKNLIDYPALRIQLEKNLSKEKNDSMNKLEKFYSLVI